MVPRKPRRRPRYAGFLVTGGVIGLVADVMVVLGPGADAQSRSQLFLFLALLLVGTGALLGGLLAVLIEGRVPRPPRDRADAPGDAARTTADP